LAAETRKRQATSEGSFKPYSQTSQAG